MRQSILDLPVIDHHCHSLAPLHVALSEEEVLALFSESDEPDLRIVSPYWGREMESVNIELKCSDPSNNPYIALGGMLAAGLDGIEKEIEPGEALMVDPARLSEEERESRGIRRLPTTLEEAIGELERDEVLCEAMGPVLAREYLIVKRAVWEGFKDKDEAFELAQHFYKF